MQSTPYTPARLRRRVFGQLWMLALQFVLGMGLNLLDAHLSAAGHTLYVTIFVMHVINAIGLLEGGIYIALRHRTTLAGWALVAVTLTMGAGIATAATGNNGWSFAMAIGFLVTTWLNCRLYLDADRQLCRDER